MIFKEIRKQEDWEKHWYFNNAKRPDADCQLPYLELNCWELILKYCNCMSKEFYALALLSRRTGSGFGANMKAEEYASERTRNSIVTRSRGAIELKPHEPIVVRKQTRTISFNRVNHLFLSSLSLTQFLFSFLDTCGHKMDTAREATF